MRGDLRHIRVKHPRILHPCVAQRGDRRGVWRVEAEMRGERRLDPFDPCVNLGVEKVKHGIAALVQLLGERAFLRGPTDTVAQRREERRFNQRHAG